MPTTPTVSVIVPAFRVAPYIAATIDSVLAQTWTDFEIVVVNDGSPDTPALLEALRPYQDRIVYREHAQGGAAKARNTAIAAAQGQFLAFLDGDDLWTPEFLEAQIACLRAAPDATLVWADSQPFGGAPGAPTLMTSEPPAPECDVVALLLGRCVVVTSTTVARRDAVSAVGGFDDTLERGEDFDLWLRLAQRGRVIYNPRVLGHRRINPTSLSAATSAMLRAQILVRQRFLERVVLGDEVQRLAAEADRRCRGQIARAEAHRLLAVGDTRAARVELAEAAAAQPGLKVAVTLRMLAIAPSMVVALHRWRYGSIPPR